jgi:hypothetical protein
MEGRSYLGPERWLENIVKGKWEAVFACDWNELFFPNSNYFTLEERCFHLG